MKNFIDLADWSSQELHELLDLARRLKSELRNGGNAPLLQGKTLGLIFQKPSLRTRVSFEVGMRQLGGWSINLGPEEIGLGKRESVADVARVVSRYVDGIMARVYDHEHVLALSEWSTVPVINGLSDAQHPCQAMADMLTIYEHFGKINGIRIAYVGDGNNVTVSLGQAAASFGAHFVVGTPAGYSLSEEALNGIAETAEANGGSLEAFHSPELAVANADVIYTDTWVSMGQEAEAEERIGIMQPYQVNAALLRHANPNAIVMHCLPAHRGQEITDDVADGMQSVIFDQAENRLHAQKAVLVRLMASEDQVVL